MTRSRSRYLRGRLLVLSATVLWGTSATLARYVFRDRAVPPMTVVELRLLISTALLAVWLRARKPSALIIERRDWAAVAIIGLFGVAAIQGGYYHSISVLGVGVAILIQYLAPTLIVLWELLHGARINFRVAAALIAALIGTGLLVGNVGHPIANARPQDWLISFSTAFTFAFYILSSKRVLARYAPETLLVYTFLVAGVFWAFVTPPWKIIQAGYDATTWWLFLALALTSALFPFMCFYAGLRRLPAAEAGILATLEPVVAVLAAWAVLGESLAPLQWMGALLVLIAAMLATRGAELRRRPRDTP